MPAPNRRNKGAILAQVTTREDGRAVSASDIKIRRERDAAHEMRHASQWEEANARLTLAERAAQVRKEEERAFQLRKHSEKVAKGRLVPPPDLRPDGSGAAPRDYSRPVEARFWLGHCLHCEREIWVHNRKPRVPLCSNRCARRYREGA